MKGLEYFKDMFPRMLPQFVNLLTGVAFTSNKNSMVCMNIVWSGIGVGSRGIGTSSAGISSGAGWCPLFGLWLLGLDPKNDKWKLHNSLNILTNVIHHILP